MTALHVTMIRDAEGFGRCSHCDREGLRWIVTLSDGTNVGQGCAREILGYAVSARGVAWQSEFVPTASHTEGPDTYVLWARRDGRPETRITRNGLLTMVGGARVMWRERGWPLAPVAGHAYR